MLVVVVVVVFVVVFVVVVVFVMLFFIAVLDDDHKGFCIMDRSRDDSHPNSEFAQFVQFIYKARCNLTVRVNT